MCEYMTGGRLNKRIDGWNCEKGEEMNSSALVLGTGYRMQQPAREEGDRAIAQDRGGHG